MCKIIDWSDNSIQFGTRCYPRTERDRNYLFNAMINGHLTHIYHRDSVAEKVMVSISTICALLREFDYDWMEEQLSDKPVEDQRSALIMLGQYCQIPVKTLFAEWRHFMKVGRRKPSLDLYEVIAKFQNYYKQDQSAWWMLATCLFTAFKAVRMSHPDFSTPFEIMFSKDGSVRINYYYRSSKSKRVRVKTSRPLCHIPLGKRLSGVTRVLTDRGTLLLAAKQHK